jgi:hypothetical protein
MVVDDENGAHRTRIVAGPAWLRSTANPHLSRA